MKTNTNKYNHFELTALRYKGTVIRHVLPKVIFFILYTFVIVAINEWVYRVNIGLPLSLSVLINSSVSLLLVFRTNTAYDRYWEGRKLWSNMTTAIRNLTRICLVNVPNTSKEEKKEKLAMLDLLIAYPIAVKHYLREEYGTDYSDLRERLKFMPESKFPSALNSSGNQALPHSTDELLKGTNLPLDIKMYLSSFIKYQQNKGNLSVPVATQLLNNLTSLVDCLNGFERILRTPIPLAYSIHLSQIVWGYFLFLPFQLIGSPAWMEAYNLSNPTNKLTLVSGYRWITIPAMALLVFTFFGVINIGEEIENPFGYDRNDLPLDDFCVVLEEEILSLAKYEPPKVESWKIST